MVTNLKLYLKKSFIVKFIVLNKVYCKSHLQTFVSVKKWVKLAAVKKLDKKLTGCSIIGCRYEVCFDGSFRCRSKLLLVATANFIGSHGQNGNVD